MMERDLQYFSDDFFLKNLFRTKKENAIWNRSGTWTDYWKEFKFNESTPESKETGGW